MFTHAVLRPAVGYTFLSNCDAKVRRRAGESKEESQAQLSFRFHTEFQYYTTYKRKHYGSQDNRQSWYGQHLQEVHIGTVQNYNPNATTVINHNYGERHKAPAAVTPALPEADLTPLRDEVLHYVMKIQGCVSPQWAERYSTLWHQVLAAPEVEAVIYKPGKQQNTAFNRTLVANIIYIMYKEGVLQDVTASRLAELLEGDKDHSVRGRLHDYPDDSGIRDCVTDIIRCL